MGGKLFDKSKLSEKIFEDISSIIYSLNKRYRVKMYSVYFQNDRIQKIYRTKKSINGNGDDKFSIESESKSIENFEDLCVEIGIKSKGSGEKQFIRLINNTEELRKGIMKIEAEKSTVKNDPLKHELNTRLGEKKHNRRIFQYKAFDGVFFWIELQSFDQDIQEDFHDRSVLSFLSTVLEMLFEYRFSINKTDDGEFYLRVNENIRGFLRKAIQVHIGNVIRNIRMKTMSIEGHEGIRKSISDRNLLTDELIDNIEDIASKTYEKSTPLGSILFVTEKEKPDYIDFVVLFEEEDITTIDMSEQMRKLLELSNRDKGLYLISDCERIIGLGRIRWRKLDKRLLVRLDFKGVMKYEMNYLFIKDRIGVENDDGNEQLKRIISGVRNIFRMRGKVPQIGNQESSGSNFRRIIKTEFGEKITDDGIEKLEKIITSAQQQKHGTMIVITDNATASDEIVSLKRQSILIKPEEIKDKYITDLTAIDGAMYFDCDGKCHGIGVILDGLAEGAGGSAARGARYNSAHKYMHKLDGKGPCVIVMISEDGMVNILPENNQEAQALEVITELNDYIDQIDMDNKKNNNVKEYNSNIEKMREKLKQFSELDLIGENFYFTIGEKLEKKRIHKSAAQFYEDAKNRSKYKDVSAAKAAIQYDIISENETDEDEKKIYLERAAENYRVSLEEIRSRGINPADIEYLLGRVYANLWGIKKEDRYMEDAIKYFDEAIKHKDESGLEDKAVFEQGKGDFMVEIDDYIEGIRAYVGAVREIYNQEEKRGFKSALRKIEALIKEDISLLEHAKDEYHKLMLDQENIHELEMIFNKFS